MFTETPHGEALRRMLPQLLIVLVRRLVDDGAPLVVPVQEIDRTGDALLHMALDTERREFTFRVDRKN
jgi:hypothetical protein